MFRSHDVGDNYNTYIGKAYSTDKSGRRKYSHGETTQETLNKKIKSLLEKNNIDISDDKAFCRSLGPWRAIVKAARPG